MTESRGYSYFVLVANPNLPINLDDLKTQLKILVSNTEQDDYLTLIILAVSRIAEEIMQRTLLETEFRTYRDFLNPIIKLVRFPFISLESFRYSVDDVFQDVDSSLYYMTKETGFSKLVLRTDSEYPCDIDDRLDSVLIDFKAGYGGDYTSIPKDIYMAMLNHANSVYENRGDCDADINQISSLNIVWRSLPSLSRAVYDLNRPIHLVGDGYIG